MRKYGKNNSLLEAVCNGCGKNMCVENGLLKEAIFEAKQSFGYFSQKDGETHKFDLCESCYDKMIGAFAVPVVKLEEKEIM